MRWDCAGIALDCAGLRCLVHPFLSYFFFSDDLYSYRRGDIPIFNFDEADRILIQTLQELIEALRKLKAEVNIQKQETMLLAKALQECKACRIKRPECSDDPPPCFPKVECR